MIGLLRFGLAILISPFRSKSRLEAENAVLRHQLIVLRRKMRGRPQLTHAGFRRYWRWKSRPRGGRPQIEPELRRADPADERREPALGSATHPRGTAQAWV